MKDRGTTQMRFQVVGNGLEVCTVSPYTVFGNREIWKGRPKGTGVFFDRTRCKEAVPVLFDTRTLDTIGSMPFGVLKNISAFIIVTPHLFNPGCEIAPLLEAVVPVLKKSAPVYVLENAGGNRERGLREVVMKEAGLHKVTILMGPTPLHNIIWEARMEVRRKPGVPVDLTKENPEKPWIIKKRREMWLAMVARYRELGMAVVDAEELLSELRCSNNPPKSLGALRMGLGVTVRASCECGQCLWKYPLSGDNPQRIYKGEDGCDGVPLTRNNEKRLIKKTQVCCFDCGGMATRIQFQAGSVVNTEVVCPHCGTLG